MPSQDRPAFEQPSATTASSKTRMRRCYRVFCALRRAAADVQDRLYTAELMSIGPLGRAAMHEQLR